MRPRKPFIDEHYQAVKVEVRADIHSRPDAYLVSVNVNEYATYLLEKFGFREINLTTDRDVQIEKIRKMIERDGFQGMVSVEHLLVRVSLPVEPDIRISKILEFSPSTFSFSAPKLEYRNGWIITEVSASEDEVQRAVVNLKDEVARRNSDIRSQNHELRMTIDQWIAARRKLIENEDALLNQISQKISVTLKRKVDSSAVIPPVLNIKEKVRPIIRPAVKAPIKVELDPQKFFAVLELIANTCRLFERTPNTFAKMEEEELRNVILSNLNSVYEGDAVGEAFSKRGKTDIYLKIAQHGGVFIAECKYWDGPKTIDDSVNQILGYLTWRDSYGVVIIFSKRTGFTKVLEAGMNRVSQLPSYAKAFKKIDDAHFSASFSLPEDEHKTVELHFLIYNLCDKQN